MKSLIKITLLGLIRDRVLQALMLSSLLMLAIPSVSSLSMRQVTELSITFRSRLSPFCYCSFRYFWFNSDLARHGAPVHVQRPVAACYAIILYARKILCNCSMYCLCCHTARCALNRTDPLGKLTLPIGSPIVWDVFLAALVFTVLKYALLTAFAFLFFLDQHIVFPSGLRNARHLSRRLRFSAGIRLCNVIRFAGTPCLFEVRWHGTVLCSSEFFGIRPHR